MFKTTLESGMNETNHVKKRMRDLLDLIMELMPAESGFLLVFERTRLEAWVGTPGVPDAEGESPPDTVISAALEVVRSGKSLITTGREHAEGGPGGNGVSSITVLLFGKGRVAGVLHMEGADPDHRFCQDDLVTIEDAIRDVGTDIENLLLNLKMEEQDRLHRMLLSKMISAQEDERKRIAADVHDDTVQSLVGSFYRLEGVELLIEQERLSEAREELSKTRASLQRNISGMRRLMFELRPSILDDAGLAPAIENYLNRMEDQDGIHGVLHVDGGLERLDSTVEVTLYRLAQEALTNVRKHSEATELVVNVVRRGGMIEISIRDNGVGFDVDEVLNEIGYEEHFGLKSLIERAELTGGRAKIETCPGEGTEVTILVPWRK